MPSIEPRNPILIKMLDRLFTALLNGPSINCRPHASRQRIDLHELCKFQDVAPSNVLVHLLSGDTAAKLTARVSRPVKSAVDENSPDQSAAVLAWENQQAVRSKLRIIADDARTYEQDTGVSALHLGFPILSLPPGMFAARAGATSSRRVLAPIAFIPLSLIVKNGPHAAIELSRRDGAENVVPNDALLTWLERESGKSLTDMTSSDHDLDVWNEIALLTRTLADALGVLIPHPWGDANCPHEFNLQPVVPDDADMRASILPSAVLGLYPASNQGLIRDTREMIASGSADGPLASFVRHGVSLEPPPVTAPAPTAATQMQTAPGVRNLADEKMIAPADPCQVAAVRLAADQRGLVIHGPPGTGKSQTITNIISDHLGRGRRVLFVCDKRTALDVVSDRLTALGLGGLCAIVHDPRRDQRDLYRSLCDQLDGLADAPVNPRAVSQLAQCNAEIQKLHDDLERHHRTLVDPHGGPGSFHDLVGQWLVEAGCEDVRLDEAELSSLSGAELQKHEHLLKEILDRGQSAGWIANAWKIAAGIALGDFLAAPMEQYRSTLAVCVKLAGDADALRDPQRPSFAPGIALADQAAEHTRLAGQLADALDRIPSVDRERWMKRPIEMIRDSRDRLSLMRDWADALRLEPSDFDEASVIRQRLESQSADELARNREILNRYFKSFNLLAAEFSRVRRVAGAQADDATILHWLADSSHAAGALRRLEAARPLVAAVEQSLVDPALCACVDRLRINATQVGEWVAALDGYLEIASKPLGALKLSRRRATAAVLRTFNFTLSPASAEQVRQFLLNYLARVDLHDALEASLGARFGVRPGDDDSLIGTFHRHFVVLCAMSNPAPDKASDGPVSLTDGQSAIIHQAIAKIAAPAAELLAQFELSLSPTSARRLEMTLRRLEARMRLSDVFNEILAAPGIDLPAGDEALVRAIETYAALLDLLVTAHEPQTHKPVAETIIRALTDTESAGRIIVALERSTHRAASIESLCEALSTAAIFDAKWLASLRDSLMSDGEALAAVQPLSDKLSSLEGILRAADALTKLPASLAASARTLLDAGAAARDGYSAIRRAVLHNEISRRLRAEPDLQNIDGHRLQNTFERFRELSEQKRALARDVILGQWTQRQKNRLLSQPGTRLNSLAGDLRRRITGRGNKALRLRQVLAHGANCEGGDPLLELRPIWMASPETVAQLFPMRPVFDLVVFDEASQCKLEEALPVLTRAGRVVIAGDPQQLPPARFFESSLASTEPDDADTEQALFESQQSEIEDLLAAALGLDVRQAYLDVHYRSKSADLIAFSNEQFYNARLQPLPSSPASRPGSSPIVLHCIEGVYEKRRNDVEANRVVAIVKELLSCENPPSIGIACFNLPQRDWIAEKLDAAAEEDGDFAARLAAARTRQGTNSAEGLFVKNLENVQGDERDHLIISTTYGPDKSGRFRRNFGPVGKPGGGRRLNVLITRARERVHVITSVPRSAYATLSPIPQGHRPSGAWLLFAYLNFCEALERRYAENENVLDAGQRDTAAHIDEHASRTPSTFAHALATKLADRSIAGADVYSGGEAFCIDLALHLPAQPHSPALAVLCDTTRYESEDPIAWEIFRSGILASRGWAIHRVWTPHFFRDPAGAVAAIEQDLLAAAEKQAGDAASAQSDSFRVREVVARRRKLKSPGKSAA